jgi:hypothetical protein
MDVITTAQKLTFQRNMEQALQQNTSKLEPAFMYQTGLAGKKMQFVELYGATDAVEDLPRKADTPDIDSPVEGVWIQPHQIAWGKLMELEDVIKNVMDPATEFIKAGASAVVRRKDRRLKAALFGDRLIGEDGATTAAWNGNTIAGTVGSADEATATGMNVKKILRGIRYFQEAQVDIDTEDLWCLTNAQGMEELYRDITYVNTDYRNKSVLEGKQVREILNTRIIVADGSAALDDYDGTYHLGAMWCKSGVRWGEFSPLRSDIPLRADKMNRPHPQMELWLGSSRSEDLKVHKLLNKK